MARRVCIYLGGQIEASPGPIKFARRGLAHSLRHVPGTVLSTGTVSRLRIKIHSIFILFTHLNLIYLGEAALATFDKVHDRSFPPLPGSAWPGLRLLEERDAVLTHERVRGAPSTSLGAIGRCSGGGCLTANGHRVPFSSTHFI